MEYLSTGAAASNVTSNINLAWIVHFVEAVETKNFLFAFQHRQAPRKAVAELDYVFKHCFSKDDSRHDESQYKCTFEASEAHNVRKHF